MLKYKSNIYSAEVSADILFNAFDEILNEIKNKFEE